MGQVVSFDDISKKLPQSILLDTDFLLNFTHEHTGYPSARPKEHEACKKHSADCKTFLENCAKHRIRIIICDIVFNEFCHQIYKDVLQVKDFKGWYNKYKANRYLIKPGHSKIKRVHFHLQDFFNEEIRQAGKAVRKKAIEIMKSLHLCPNDSYITSIGIENRLDGIATFNVLDFHRIAKAYPIDIYLPKELI